MEAVDVPGMPKPEIIQRTGSLSTVGSKHLRSNLMREQRDRDPLFYYEVQQILGVGSMGSVVRVTKRSELVGGSARKELQGTFQREKNFKRCIQIPLIGPFLQNCIRNPFDDGAKEAKKRNSIFKIRSPFHPPDSERSLASNGGKAPTYAMKSIHLSRVTDKVFVDELRNEIKILKKLDHPHIVRLIETFEHRNQIFIIMEACSGGDLYSRDPYTEDQAARIVNSILSALSFMHDKNIIHRDLKYENILFVNDGEHSEIKLIDFGLSKRYGNDELTEGVGTIYTMAPEVLIGKYTEKADVWSVGVISYMLLSSQMPFYGKKRKRIVELITNCQYNFKGRRWKRVSDQAKAFVEDLLVLDPEYRLSAYEAAGSTWLNRGSTATTRNPYADEELVANQSLVKFAGYSKLKKVAMMIVAHKSSSDEIGILRKVFQNYDRNKSGDLSYEEFCQALTQFGYSEEQLRPLFEAVDLDGSGRIRYTEFLAATLELHGAIKEEHLAEAFDRLDCDDSGYITAENLIEILGPDFSQKEIDEIFEEAELSSTKQISFPQFLALWEEKTETKREEIVKDLEFMSSQLYAEDSDDEEDEHVGAGIAARTSFIESKRLSKKLSKRKMALAGEALEEVMGSTNGDIKQPRQVFFQEDIQVILPSEDHV